MKKTLIALLALGSIAMATDLRVQNGETYELAIDSDQQDHLIFGATDTSDPEGVYSTVVKSGHENRLWSIMRFKEQIVGTINFSLEDGAEASTKHDAGNMNWNAKAINLTLGKDSTMVFGNSLNMKCADQTALTITLGENSVLTFGGRASLGVDDSSKHETLTFNFSAGSSINAGTQVISFGDIMENTDSALVLNAALSADELVSLETNGVGSIIQRTLITSGGIDHLAGIPGTVTTSIYGLNQLGYESVGLVTDVSTLNDGQYAFYKNGNKLDLYVKSNGVPEPATATLSLLALAGLTARRRRH